MLFSVYIFCGFLYTIYFFNKILQNKEGFLFLFEQENKDLKNLKSFMFVLTLLSFIAWPIMMLNEIKNKQDF